MNQKKTLETILLENRNTYSPIIPLDLHQTNLLIFDLSENNSELQQINVSHTPSFSKYIFNKMAQAHTLVAIGKYNEQGVIYKNRSPFEGDEPRSIHLGIDLWAEAGTTVSTPLSGKIHSFKNNKSYGDYGPTIIIEHFLEGFTFYTLYGHLSLASLLHLSIGKVLESGEKIGKIGPFPENGDWPPHLHFQIITDMQEMEGDFPGVAAVSRRDQYLRLCPNPNLILGIAKL